MEMPSTKKNRIAVIAPFAGPAIAVGEHNGAGGSERQLALVASRLEKLGWEVTFIIDKEFRAQRFAFSRVLQAPFRYLGGSKLFLLPDILALIRAIHASRASIVLLRAGGPFISIGMLLSKFLLGCKAIHWIQIDADVISQGSWKRRLHGLIYMRCLRFSDLVIVQSKNQEQAVSKAIPKACIKFVPNIDARLPTEGDRIHSLKRTLSNSPLPVVLWAGNTMKKKRHELAYQVAQQLETCVFLIAMIRSDNSRYEAAEREASQLENVRFLGEQTQSEMEEVFDLADCCLNTSTIEGFPNTFLQAWSRGIPTVTAGIDPDDVIKKHGLGVVSPVRNGTPAEIEELADALRGVLAELPDQARRRACLRYVRQHHDPDMIIGSLNEALLSI